MSFSQFLKEGSGKNTWRDLIDKSPSFPPRQDSLNDQLIDLIFVANRLGFQDAADFIKMHVKGR